MFPLWPCVPSMSGNTRDLLPNYLTTPSCQSYILIQTYAMASPQSEVPSVISQPLILWGVIGALITLCIGLIATLMYSCPQVQGWIREIGKGGRHQNLNYKTICANPSTSQFNPLHHCHPHNLHLQSLSPSQVWLNPSTHLMIDVLSGVEERLDALQIWQTNIDLYLYGETLFLFYSVGWFVLTVDCTQTLWERLWDNGPMWSANFIKRLGLTMSFLVGDWLGTGTSWEINWLETWTCSWLTLRLRLRLYYILLDRLRLGLPGGLT
jgi:hypothetical protein